MPDRPMADALTLMRITRMGYGLDRQCRRRTYRLL